MADSLIGETIEGVGGIVKQTALQAAKVPGSVASDFVEGLLGKPVSQQKAQDLKLNDQQKKQQNLAAVRSNIKSLMTPKPVPQQNPPAYISGKAGFSIEKIQKMQKLQEQQKKNPPPLPKSAQQGQGSGEIGKFVAG